MRPIVSLSGVSRVSASSIRRSVSSSIQGRPRPLILGSVSSSFSTLCEYASRAARSSKSSRIYLCSLLKREAAKGPLLFLVAEALPIIPQRYALPPGVWGKFFSTRLRRSPFYLRHQVACGLLCTYRSAVLTFWLQIYLLDSLVLALSACGENTAGTSINWLMINYLSLRHITQDLFIIIPLAFLFPFKPDYKTVQKPPLSGPSLWMRPSAFSLARCFSMAFGVIPIISASLRAE